MKIGVVAAIAGMAIGLPFHPTVAGDEGQRSDGEFRQPGQRRIICKIKATEIDGLHVGIVQLEPTVATDGPGHPFVEAQTGNWAKNRSGSVDCARSRVGEEAPATAGTSDRLIANLKAVFDVVDDLSRSVEEVSAAAVSVQRMAGIEVRLEIGSGIARTVAPNRKIAAGCDHGSRREDPLARR